MKKLLTLLSVLTLLFAFASTASAVSLFEEDFAFKVGGFSKNWDVAGGATAMVSPLIGKNKTLGLTTNSLNKKFKSTASYNFEAGNTYTVDVFAYHTLAGEGKRDFSIAFMVGDTVLAEAECFATYDTMPGYGKGTASSLSFDAIADYSGVKLVISLGEKNTTYGFESIVLSSDLTPTAATPIPGAIFLLAPGLAGVAALRRKM